MIKSVLRTAYIIGTNHKFQRGEEKKSEFNAFLNSVCCELKILLIAEEINVDSTTIIARDVAKSQSVDYLCVDPHPTDYNNYGIKPIHKIKYEVEQLYETESIASQTNGDDEVSHELAKRMLEQHITPREYVWLSKIEKFDRWPTLVICGANHVSSFSKLLNQKAIKTTLIEKHWGESYF